MSDGRAGGSAENLLSGLKLGPATRFTDLEIELATVEDPGFRARLALVQELTERYKQRREPKIHTSPFFNPREGWENQMIQVEEGQPLWTCSIATLRNGLMSLKLYDPTRDTEDQMVADVRDLFRAGGLPDAEALTRIIERRPEKGLSLQINTFTQALYSLLNNKPVLYGSRGHMVLLTGGIRAVTFREPEGNKVVLGTRKIDPLNRERRSVFEPLSAIAERGGHYRSLVKRPKLAPRR